MTDQNTDHAQLVAGDHNYSDSRWRESYLTRPYYQEAQLTTPDLDYDRDFSAAYELGHRARSESKEGTQFEGHCCKVSDEAAFCLIQRPYISKTLLTRRISPRGSP